MLAACEQKPHKTLYGTWECISEQFDSDSARTPYKTYWYDVSGTCENIRVEYRDASGGIENALTGVPVEQPKCFGNRDELTFITGEIVKKAWRLKMDASGDTLRGTYRLAPGWERTNWDSCQVVLVRVQ